MSWQATTWAMSQKIGNPSRKLLLLAVANYADESGRCWPSQERLANDTEASLDTIQRQTKKLAADGFLRVERPPKHRGKWQTFVYYLNMASKIPEQNIAADASNLNVAASVNCSDEEQLEKPILSGNGFPELRSTTRPQNAAWKSENQASDQAATSTETRPQPERKPGRKALRLKPSLEPPLELAAAAAARARDASISDGALELAEQLLVIAGHSPEFWPPGWCGAPLRIQAWLSGGWPSAIILAAAKGVMARGGAPPSSVQFFERAIADEIARQARPLPEVPQNVQAYDHRSFTTRPGGNGFARLAARLKQSAGDDNDR
jgi:Helix-turn-helix domain